MTVPSPHATIAACAGRFRGSGGRAIAWRGWSPASEGGQALGSQGASPALRGVVTIAHGYGEHIGGYVDVAERLCAAGFAVYGLDHHGHGHSQGRRGLIDLPAALTDLDQLILSASRGRHPRRRQFLLGHSMGGLLALRYAAVRQRRLNGLIVVAPLAQVDAGPRLVALGRVLGAALPWAPTKKVNPRVLSRDPAVVAAHRADALNHHGRIPAGSARQFILATSSLADDARKIELPTLLMSGTADRLCPPAGAQRVADAVGSDELTVRRYPGLFHEILREPERERVLEDLVGWLLAQSGEDR